MILSRQTRYQIGTLLATILLFSILVYASILDSRFNNIIVRVQIDADEPGIFSIFWPSSSGNFSGKRCVAVKYPQGPSTVKLVIPSFPGSHPLRLDPMSSKSNASLLGISIKRFGVVHSLTPLELQIMLVTTNDVSLALGNSGLEISSKSIDPQLYLQNIPQPLPSWSSSIVFFCFFVILLNILCWYGLRLLKYPPSRVAPQIFLVPVIFTWASFALQWPALIAVIACTLLVAAIQFLAVVAINGKTKVSILQAKAVLVICCFFTLIYVPFFKTLTLNNGFTPTVREELAKTSEADFPEFNKTIGELLKGIEDNFIRHFAFLHELKNLNANIKIFGFGFSPTPKAILGKNGMFFEGYGERRVEGDITAHFDNVTDYMGLIPFTNQELQQWRICLEERYFWLKGKGIDYIFALAPSKALIYPENLPEKILTTKKTLNKLTRYDQLIDYLKKHSIVPVVNLSQPLREAKEKARKEHTKTALPLYYRTDFHWTYYGAYIAYRAIVEEINDSYPQYLIHPTPLSDFSIKSRPDWVHIGFIYALGLNPVHHKNETYLTFHPKANTPLHSLADFGAKGIDDYSLPALVKNNYSGHVIASRELLNKSGKLKTLFVIGDSFSEKYFGFFAAHAKKTVNFRTVYSFFTAPYEKYHPDIVIQEVLNMYLLQPPPSNPPAVREARENALARATPIVKIEPGG